MSVANATLGTTYFRLSRPNRLATIFMSSIIELSNTIHNDSENLLSLFISRRPPILQWLMYRNLMMCSLVDLMAMVNVSAAGNKTVDGKTQLGFIRHDQSIPAMTT